MGQERMEFGRFVNKVRGRQGSKGDEGFLFFL